MFERRTRYLSAAWWVVDPRMARTGEQGMALGREGEIGREGGRERERERETTAAAVAYGLDKKWRSQCVWRDLVNKEAD